MQRTMFCFAFLLLGTLANGVFHNDNCPSKVCRCTSQGDDLEDDDYYYDPSDPPTDPPTEKSGPAPAPAPTQPPRITPRLHYIYWVRQPFVTESLYKCDDACKKENTPLLGEICHGFEYDHFYKTCYLYKKEYVNPGAYSSFNDMQRVEWALANAVKPEWRTYEEQADLLTLVIKQWWSNVPDSALNHEFVDSDGNEWTDEMWSEVAEDFRYMVNMELRQYVLIEQIIESFHKNEHDWFMPKTEVKQLIRRVFGDGLDAPRLIVKLQIKILHIEEENTSEFDYVGPRRLLSFGEASA